MALTSPRNYKDLKVGDVFYTQGYDTVATYSTYLGELRYDILCNNSDHYLVVSRRRGEDGEWLPQAQLVQSYQYYGKEEDGPSVYQAWQAASGEAFIHALRTSREEGGD